MSTVANSGADSFAAKPAAHLRLFLVHGPDEGLVRERARRIEKAWLDGADDPFAIVSLAGDEVAQDPGKLADEAFAVSMFGGKRAIRVEIGARDAAAAFAALVERPPADCAVIALAGALRKGHALRSLFEGSRAAASVECYPDEARDLARLVEETLRAEGLAVDPDAREALVGLLGDDRMTTRSELAKLALYSAGTGRVTAADVEAIVTDASASSLDQAVDAAFLGEVAATETALSRALVEGGEAGMAVGAALRHAQALHLALVEAEARGGEANVPPQVFYKRKPAFQRQARMWSAARIARAMEGLREASAAARADSRLGRLVAARAYWTLALSARRGG